MPILVLELLVNLSDFFVKVGGGLIEEVVPVGVLLVVSVALQILDVLVEAHGRVNHQVLFIDLFLFIHGHGFLVIFAIGIVSIHGRGVIDAQALHFPSLNTQKFSFVLLFFVENLIIDLLYVLKAMRIVVGTLIRGVHSLVRVNHGRK
jgi:hypothetical protein